ncbi:PLD nuclease N-terminal domain-containing protein [Streptomyces sp. W1SF4]|uniref:PLD nuclease N-terminal domain-containing protein n=1 Tax=Streptomyces sp. W1SF4 TaxID=2305220 RepID=UPI000F70D0FF|nr:PLD nuclease N-terminal domain-containing protein [Streptomyces sp. W1SF4]AZM89626.1 PLDc_N domain-containing protein [Streptomyces sp. W1SF4]
MLRYLPFLLILALTIYAFIDCLNTPEEEVKHLPKTVWVLIILLFSIVGPVVWLFAGRKRSAAGGGGRARRQQWVAPDDNPEFLKSLREEQEKNRDKDGDTDKGKDKE